MDAPLQRIELVNYDITAMKADAIVNAANSLLRCGGGVDAAIHDVAGPELQVECLKIGGCPTGEARLTRGYRLPAAHVIHAVGPIYRDGRRDEPALLRSCYEHSLAIAAREKFRTIAFPAISCGSFGYPLRPAAEIAVKTVLGFLAQNEFPGRVTFCCRDAPVYMAYEQAIAAAELGRPPAS